jgi:hypothetical protein
MSDAKAEDLLARLLKGKAIHDKFAKDMREKLLINGESMDSWEDKFKITINTNDLNPAICKQLDLLLLEHNQEVAFYHAVASAKSQMLKRGGDSAYRDKFYALVQEYKEGNKKLPAAATLENLAKVENDDIESAQSIAEVEKLFWSNILDHLTTCRKIIENATLNSNVEAKLNR